MKPISRITSIVSALLLTGSMVFLSFAPGNAQPTSPEKRQQLTPELTPTPLPTLLPTGLDTEEVRPEVINLIFPTPGPLPISAWRPPLYPVPWAASEYDHFFLQRPIAADTINWPVPDYRYGGIYFGPEVVHTGVDIASPSGSDVIAAADGKVVWAGYGLFSVEGNMQDPYGLAVAIRHDFGFQGKRLYTVYAHMRAVNVISGQQVKTGDQLGEVGETGHATGPHLHFEVRLGRNNFFDTRNPELWMAPPQGWGVLVGKITDKNGKTLIHKEIHIYPLDGNREWIVRTYGQQVVNPDDHYQENLVLSDLPAGKYRLWFNYEDKDYYGKFEIYPGSITQIAFTGEKGFSVVSTKPDFIPQLTEPAP